MNRVTVSTYPARVTLHCGQNKVTLRYAQKGERGIGISNVALDDKAHLIVTYDDGKTQDAGAALGDVASVKDGIDSSYKKVQTSEANVTKLEASTKANADKAQQALQDTQSASTSGVNAINTLVSEKMTYMTSTFNSLLIQAKANIDQLERDAEDKIHKERTYSLEQIKTAHDDAMVDIERSVNKAEAWAVSETTPDRESDFESPTGLTQSSRSWALLSKKKVQEAFDTLKDIKDNETSVSNMKNDVTELLHRTQTSEQNTQGYMNDASASQKAAKESENTAETYMENAKASEVNAKASETASADSASKAHTSERNAKTSETNSASSASSASDSATAAASSATSASASATNAKASMNTANTAASSASTSATSASTSASNAAKAEVAAKTAQAEAEKARDDANSAVNKLTGVMKYAGQVDNYSDLESYTKNKGDIWNIVNADPAHGVKAGDNVARNGTDWDNLSGVVDLSAYAEKADYQKTITSATADGATITFNHKDGTTSTATVNNVASATAATNDAKGQRIDTTYEKVTDSSNAHTSLQNNINSLSTSKQDKLTFDLTPTADSSNPVTSSGIKTALDGKPSNTGAGASGTWPISVSGKAASATKADTIVSAAAAEASTAERPVWLSWEGDNSRQVVSPNLTYNCSTKTLTANNFNGNLTGNASTATKATQDASGNDIGTTYATKTDTANTYVKSVTYSGHTVTIAKGNGTTSTFDTADTTYPVATTTVNGLMSSADKTKLNGVATGAEVNQNAFGNVSVGTSTLQADNKQDTLYLAAGDNVNITADENNDKITIGLTGIIPVKNGGTGASSLTNITVGKATADASGNNIANTYAKKTDTYTKTEVDNKISTAHNYIKRDTAYKVGDILESPNLSHGYLIVVTQAGTTGSSEPDWPTTEGSTVTDGTVQWTVRDIRHAQNADTATKATGDSDGNNIKDTYATKTETYKKTETYSKTEVDTAIANKKGLPANFRDDNGNIFVTRQDHTGIVGKMNDNGGDLGSTGANVNIKSWYGVGFINGLSSSGTFNKVTVGIDVRSGTLKAHNIVATDSLSIPGGKIWIG